MPMIFSLIILSTFAAAQTNIEELRVTSTRREKELKVIKHLGREDLKQKFQTSLTVTSKLTESSLSMNSSEGGLPSKLQRFTIDFKSRTVKAVASVDGKELQEMLEEDTEEVLAILRDADEREALLKNQVLAIYEAVNCQTYRGQIPSGTPQERGALYLICEKKAPVFHRTDGMRLTKFSDVMRRFQNSITSSAEVELSNSRNKNKIVLMLTASVFEWKNKVPKTIVQIASFDSDSLEENISELEDYRHENSAYSRHLEQTVKFNEPLIQLLGGQERGSLRHPFADRLNYKIRVML